MTVRNFNELAEQVLAEPSARQEVDEYKRAMYAAIDIARARDLRHRSQAEVAREMGVTQGNISRLERQDDLYVSTLRHYVAALGGRLEINAVFPEETVQLTPVDSF
ncbi:MAG: XRE family transcriptional regulator [Chloroflexota bacterium]|nr:MAG: transcriptional regulator [Chloroflexota bacterium]